MLKYLLAVPAEPKKLAAAFGSAQQEHVPSGSKPVGLELTDCDALTRRHHDLRQSSAHFGLSRGHAADGMLAFGTKGSQPTKHKPRGLAYATRQSRVRICRRAWSSAVPPKRAKD